MIDIYKIKGDDREYILSLGDCEIIYWREVFDKFRQKTGYDIDEYSDLILKNEMLGNFLDIIKYEIDVNDKKILKDYYVKFLDIYNDGVSLAFYGD